jgi:tetratricopeptide (TPR) repeat protein
MDPPEYADYDNAVNKQTTPQTQAPAIEAYLVKYPKSQVKAEMLSRLLFDYSHIPDYGKAITTADQVLQLNPNDFQALTVEAIFRSQQANALTDASAKLAALDTAASYAQKGIDAPKPASVDQATFDGTKSQVLPTFYSIVGNDDLLKKDYPSAIKAFKAELSAVPIASTTVPGTQLQDTYYIGQAYFASTPPDYINCTFYATRAAAYAPAQFAAQMQPLATYCYKKYHGKADGYDAVVAAAKANLNPPADFTITPAPTDADIVNDTIKTTPDLSVLAISDKEYILKYGTPEQADKVFDTVKGKADKLPDATIIAVTPDEIQVAYSDDAVQAKTADFIFKLTTPLKKLPDVGSKITLIGTWSSYTQKPLLITMTDAEEYKAPAKAAPKKPVHHK